MKLEKLDPIKEQVDTIVILCNVKLLYFGISEYISTLKLGHMHAIIKARIVKPSTSSLHPFFAPNWLALYQVDQVYQLGKTKGLSVQFIEAISLNALLEMNCLVLISIVSKHACSMWLLSGKRWSLTMSMYTYPLTKDSLRQSCGVNR
jgi:hypothetical protein